MQVYLATMAIFTQIFTALTTSSQLKQGFLNLCSPRTPSSTTFFCGPHPNPRHFTSFLRLDFWLNNLIGSALLAFSLSSSTVYNHFFIISRTSLRIAELEGKRHMLFGREYEIINKKNLSPFEFLGLWERVNKKTYDIKAKSLRN